MNSAIPVLALVLGIILASGCLDSHTPEPGVNEADYAQEEHVREQPTNPPDTPTPPAEELLAKGDRQPLPFSRGGVYYQGDEIAFSGTTILSPGNKLLFEVTSAAFGPTSKTNDTIFYGNTSVITVQKGPVDSVNTWSYTLNTSSFEPGEYQVLISGMSVKSFELSTQFTLLPQSI